MKERQKSEGKESQKTRQSGAIKKKKISSVTKFKADI